MNSNAVQTQVTDDANQVRLFQKLDEAGFSMLKDQYAFFDFWATWCGPCLVMNPILEEKIIPHFPHVSFYKINVDEQPNLSMKFNITAIPTMVLLKFDSEGNYEVLTTFFGTQKAAEMKITMDKALAEDGFVKHEEILE